MRVKGRLQDLRMPRRALSTLRAEIKDGGSFGTSMELSESTSVVVVSAETSLELLMQSLRGFTVKPIVFNNPNLCV